MRQNRQIKQVISQIVPEDILRHIQFCRIENGRLRMTVDSAAWVARLRFSDRQLIDTLTHHKLMVSAISYHVVPPEKSIARKVQRSTPASSERSITTLKTAAAAMNTTGEEDDDRLRQELLRLAEKMRRT